MPLLAWIPAESALAASDIPRLATSSPAAASGPSELALCEFTDISIADGSGTCDCAAPELDTDREAAEPGEDSAPAADPGAASAPMCDNTAASIVATPEVPEIDGGKIEPVPCDLQHLLARLRSDDRGDGARLISGSGHRLPEPQGISAGGERLGAASTSGARRSLAAERPSIMSGGPRGLACRRGHSTRVERPPSGA